MKTVTLIDSYNLIFSLDLDLTSLEQGRHWLLERLSYQPFRSPLVLFFDGQGECHTQSQFGPLTLVYTKKDVTADQMMLAWIETPPHNASYQLVSNDRELTRMASGLGAKVISCATFWKRVKTVVKKRAQPQSLCAYYQAVFEKRLRELS